MISWIVEWAAVDGGSKKEAIQMIRGGVQKTLLWMRSSRVRGRSNKRRRERCRMDEDGRDRDGDEDVDDLEESPAGLRGRLKVQRTTWLTNSDPNAA